MLRGFYVLGVHIKKLLLLFLLIFTAISSHASLIDDVFSKSFEEDYHALTCSDNIMRLGNRLQDNGINLTNGNVVFIKHKYAPHVSIKPQLTRTTHINTRWTFHAILIIENIVYDLDYSMSATPEQLKEYLEQMWNEEDLNDYVFQIKPFDEYHSNDFGGRFNRTYYPEMNLQDFLQAIPTQ